MAKVQVSVVIDAPRKVVWAAIEDPATHVRWMPDATEIRPTSPAPVGIGSTFDCDVGVGPLTVTGVLTVTEWRPGKAVGVAYSGLVGGEGRITLHRAGRGRTRVVRRARLGPPWRLGGPVAAALARPAIHALWARSMTNLKALVESRR